MENSILASSPINKKVKFFVWISLALIFILFIVCVYCFIQRYNLYSNANTENYKRIFGYCNYCKETDCSALGHTIENLFTKKHDEPLTFRISLFLGVLATVWFVYMVKYTYGIEVTKKWIRCRSVFGKGIDYPIESVSTVTKKGAGTICIYTIQGRKTFRFLSNRYEIYETICGLLNSKQKEKVERDIPNPRLQAQTVNLHQLKELKELLDAGIITEEEFNQKKKQILDL